MDGFEIFGRTDGWIFKMGVEIPPPPAGDEENFLLKWPKIGVKKAKIFSVPDGINVNWLNEIV